MEKAQIGKSENLHAADFEARLTHDPKPTLLDVRTAQEFHAGHIPDAINIDVIHAAFYDQVSVLDKSSTYFVYCRSGGRSAHACQIMAELGFKVINLLGGIGSWQGKLVTS